MSEIGVQAPPRLPPIGVVEFFVYNPSTSGVLDRLDVMLRWILDSVTPCELGILPKKHHMIRSLKPFVSVSLVRLGKPIVVSLSLNQRPD